MRDSLFHLRRVENASLQSQIREMLVSAILEGRIPSGEPLPSSRRMAQILGVSRNTIVLTYQGLVDDGYLTSRERSGFYVDPTILDGRALSAPRADTQTADAPAWHGRFRVRPTLQHNIEKPLDWRAYPYPFIYGQVDQDLFPISAWRECSRQALGRKGMDAWTSDARENDDPMLVEQIRTRLLPRRGIYANSDEILITLGAQNALYILASLLMTTETTVAMEEPGYPDARNIISLKTGRIKLLPVDERGLPVDSRLQDVDYAYVTPSHQFPTTATMPLDRRQALLEQAAANDFVVIEDDYEAETNYVSDPTPALKTLDVDGRVIYVGSFSKTLFPGLRLGYLVGPAELISEARALRRLMLRHAPNNNQRTAALFLSLGHHDTLVHRLHRVYRQRWQELGNALQHHFPDSARMPTFGGTSIWFRADPRIDADELALAAEAKGLLIEPGTVHFGGENPPRNYLRLGFSSIPTDRIEPGIEKLAEIIARQPG
ncbi:MAG: PLP-dependent aminotransferase family protein [Magnetovibrio sp.]|nr:PLP-dependent aminotransferase family protein [Magnetovibrio sp.]